MKKFIFAVAFLASLQFGYAQQAAPIKSIGAATKAADKAKADVQNPKKALNLAAWIKYGQAMVDAYNAPFGIGWIGASREDIDVLMANSNTPAESVEVVEILGNPMIKEVYKTVEYYYNEDNVLQFMSVTEPIYPDALEQALEAYQKAGELDVKGSKKEAIMLAETSISRKFADEAYNAYSFGDYAKASIKFERAFQASIAEPNCVVDSNLVYNAGFTAWMVNDNERAKYFFEQCLAYSYEGNDGEVYAKLADIAEKEAEAASGDEKIALEAQRRDYLETAFLKYPKSQSILVGLINFYINSGENADRLFDLLNVAKQNEPTNASLYYVEGNIHNQLGQTEEAIASYRQCVKINPNYEYGYIGEGILFYNLAIKLQEEAADIPWSEQEKYDKTIAAFEEALKACIAPFEEAFRITGDNEVKLAISEYLRNACYRFREEGDNQAKYEFYNSFSGSSKN